MLNYLAVLTVLTPATFLASASPQALTWDLDTKGEVTHAPHVVSPKATDGLFRGTTTWDPSVFLALPKGGIDGKSLTRLTIRMYSSTPADHIAVYYQCDDGRWALGTSHPVVQGLAVYRIDLRQLRYHGDVSPLAGSRQWGGTSGRITTFRIDPGNQAGRWIAIDEVRLEPVSAGSFEPGVTRLSTKGGRLATITVPEFVNAGDAIQVRVTAELPDQDGGQDDQLFVWLMSGERVWADRVIEIGPRQRQGEWTVQIPTLKYAQPTSLSVRAGLLGVEIADGGFDCERGVVRVDNPLAGSRASPLVEVKRHGGDPMLFVDGKPVAPFFCAINGVRLHDQRAEMGRAGIHLFSDWFGSSGASTLGHVASDEYDYTEFDSYFAKALEADPDAYFLPHVGITPPMWWQHAHPEELCLYADGGHGPQSFASERWRKETAEDLRRLIRHLQSAPYADRIIGYLPFSGYSAEWQSWGLWQNHLADYSEPAKRAWRKWLIKRYGANSPYADVAMPTPEQRHIGHWGALRDPDAERATIDYYLFLANLTTDAIAHFAHVVKEATNGRSLCGTYYGYLTQHGPRQQDSSHLALAKVLRCDDLDFLASPPLYTDRAMGQTCGFMSATESVRLHGKLWLSEADYRTHLSEPGSGYGRADTREHTNALLWREMGNVLTRRTAVSHYDMVGGWLEGAEITAELGKMRDAMEASLANRRTFHGDLAVVVDERSFAYLTAMHPLTGSLVLQSIIQLPRVGVAWDFHLLDDLVNGELPPHKAYLFLNAVMLDSTQRAAIRARLEREGATAIWVYAPGLYDDDSAGVEQIHDLTGFAVRRETWGKPLQVADAEGALLAGDKPEVDPIFIPDATDAEELGHVEGTDFAGLARKSMGAWTSVFCSTPRLLPDTLRRLARDAGCHVYLGTGDALFVDNQYVCLHASKGGDKVVTLREPCRPRAVFGSPTLHMEGTELRFAMQANKTVLLRIDSE